ncbi:ankyrin repeat domain-containing protein [Sphingobacterium sp. SRCM116780]|uniref:ankyrin repeat domain-containing protein n=1 Tax=Sphingobacterium sp. SRCM116780 TaxID=2907623 RepID=UPI001F44B13D|nr:ankyrin repeat domain-containing protein [Sphingobacterium sp. SRCM116780]UIR54942.1 ankyrin repeat domain-containing protein [Sphingobacterium sp. SRCM116780]
MNLYQIEQAYLQGKENSEINELYKNLLEDETENEQIEIWKQVCSFANVEMIDYLIAKGWRTTGVEDQDGNTLLHLLAQPKHGYNYFIAEQRVYECTKKLLETKVSPLRKNNDGDTALLLSSRVGYTEMLQAYAEIGAKTDFTDRNGNTLLHIIAQYSSHAVSAYQTAMERLLIHQNDSNFDAENPRQAQERAELEWHFNVNKARFNQFITYAITAMEFNADPYQKNNEGETAIDVAIYYQSKAIGAILKGVDFSNQETVPLYFEAGGMNIYQACAKNDLEALNALIQIGEDLNEAYDKEGDKFNGMTPLAIAMTQHYFEVTDVLLKNGADATLRDSKAWHPFRYLYTPVSGVNTNFDQFQNKVFPKILNAYLDAGFDINSLLDDDENTLLTVSAKYADDLQLYNGNSITTVLIDEVVYSNADVNKTNRDGISALMYLCLADTKRGEKNLITLLEQSASTELRDKNGKTALIYAVNNSDKSAAKTYCELLVEFGNLLIDAKDNAGKSALDYAVVQNNEPLVAWLVERM